MCKILNFLCLSLLLLIAILVIAFYYSDEIVYWTSLSSKESPNDELLASAYSYGSDGDRHAPYGTYVFLNPAIKLAKSTKGHVVFAGYCENTPTLNWHGNFELSIKCKLRKGENLRTLSKVSHGVTINFESE